MRTKKLFLFIFTFALITTMAFARGPNREGPPESMMHGQAGHVMAGRMPGLRMRFLGVLFEDPAVQEELGLSKDKSDKIKTIISDSKKFNIKTQADKEVLFIDLQTEMEKDTIDEAKIKNLAEKINQLSNSLFMNNIMNNVKILNLLTPTQKEKLQTLSANRRTQLRKKFKKARKSFK